MSTPRQWRTQAALNEFVEASAVVSALTETSGPKRIRPPHVGHALGASARNWEREKRNRDPRRRFDIMFSPEEMEKTPNPEALRRAVDRESPGPSPSVQAFHRRKAEQRRQAEIAAKKVRRQARKERRTASRERRLKAQGRPLDYTKAPKRAGS
jgi:hypothetical protein